MASPSFIQLDLVPHDGLIVVDMQNDFFREGRLPVPHAEAILSAVNFCLDRFSDQGLSVFATRCWHPQDHCSFKAQGGLWPVHCVAGSAGAEFHPQLRLPLECTVFSKGNLVDRDAYSGFAGTELGSVMIERGIKRVFVCGLATDYCVLHTVLDALEKGWGCFVFVDAIAAVEVASGDGERAIEKMRAAGAVMITTEALGAAI